MDCRHDYRIVPPAPDEAETGAEGVIACERCARRLYSWQPIRPSDLPAMVAMADAIERAAKTAGLLPPTLH